MKILQICSKPPFPYKDGGTLAMHVLTEGLIKAGAEIKVMAISTPKNLVTREELPEYYKKSVDPQIIYIDTSVKIIPAILNLFHSGSYNIQRFYSKKFEERLIQILKENNFDIIHLETLWVTPYIAAIRKYSKAKIILRSQNVEFKIWERLAEITGNPLKKAYFNLLGKRLKKYEISMLNNYDAIAAITPEDANEFLKLGCTKPVIHIPFGINSQDYMPSVPGAEISLFSIGAMDWLPNLESVKWFLDNVWQKINNIHPFLKFYIAGRNMPPVVKELKIPGVIVAGEVPDAKEFIRSKSIMVVPLFSGGGMRIKIIEGMALGKTIISTSIGAEGINYRKNSDILIADTAEEFITMINKCIADIGFAKSVGENARKVIEDHYDNTKICLRLFKFYREL